MIQLMLCLPFQNLVEHDDTPGGITDRLHQPGRSHLRDRYCPSQDSRPKRRHASGECIYSENNSTGYHNCIHFQTACEQFLGKSESEIQHIALVTLEGHQRAIMGSMTVEEIYKDRKKFSKQVFEVASSDLVNMGITVVSYTLKDIRDEEVSRIVSHSTRFLTHLFEPFFINNKNRAFLLALYHHEHS